MAETPHLDQSLAAAGLAKIRAVIEQTAGAGGNAARPFSSHNRLSE
jgi:hypothetical protein